MDRILSLPRSLLRKAVDLWRRLWVRVALFGLFAVAALGLAQLVEPRLPGPIATVIDGASTDRLLDVIANAMLAATIFALTVMVSVYRSSASQWTPRVHRLIMEDPTTQNTLATFIGTWVFALTAIVLRETGAAPDDRALVLFALTCIVIAFMVWSLIRWTLHLQTFGSLIDITRHVEDITSRRFAARLSEPCLGAHPLTDDTTIPDSARPVVAGKTGYLDRIWVEALQDAAEKADARIWILAEIGSFVFEGETVARIDGGHDDPEGHESFLLDHLEIGDVRTYHQDPRFGLIVLSEIASRALSPGINDPGTAIDVVNRAGRILSGYSADERESREVLHDRLWIRPLDPAALIGDAFDGVGRDGAGVIEVQERLQRVLCHLARSGPPALARAARDAAARHAERAREAMTAEADRRALAAACAWLTE